MGHKHCCQSKDKMLWMRNKEACSCLLLRCLFSVHSCCFSASGVWLSCLWLHVQWQWSHNAEQEMTLLKSDDLLHQLQWWTFTVLIQKVSPLKGEIWGQGLLKARGPRWPSTVAVNYIINVFISTFYLVSEAVARLSYLLNRTSRGERVSLHHANLFN